MTPATLPLSDIVNVVVLISPQAPPLPTFNQGLIIGSSAAIPPWGSSLMLLKANAGGTGYAVGDVSSVTQSGGSGGQVKVLAIGASGAVTAVGIYQAGTGYAAASGLATANVIGTGSGLTIDVINVGSENARLRQYSSLGAMLSDGFTVSDPEYIAGSLYFGQTPPPQYLWVGVQNAAGAIATAPVTAGGTGYAVGDLIGVIGGNGGLLVVTTVGTDGVVTGVAILQNGDGYSAGVKSTTTNGAGSGFTSTITVGAESLLQAATYCRAQNFLWYGLYACGAQKSDHEALGTWAQTASPATVYFYNTADSDALNNIAGNVFAYLNALKFNRCYGLYSTTQGGVYLDNAYAAAAAMGVAFGLNTGLQNSYFTMKFKTLIGVAVEPVTETQRGNIEANGGNVYVNYGNAYSFEEQGTQANKTFFDEVLQLDMLTADIQYSVMNLLTAMPAVPQTDQGQALLIHAVNGAADRAVLRGFIAAGNAIWQGVQLVNLKPGQPLPKGYLAQSFSYNTQSRSDREARKAMPIYLAIIEAGAVHSLTVGVYVQR